MRIIGFLGTLGIEQRLTFGRKREELQAHAVWVIHHEVTDEQCSRDYAKKLGRCGTPLRKVWGSSLVRNQPHKVWSCFNKALHL